MTARSSSNQRNTRGHKPRLQSDVALGAALFLLAVMVYSTLFLHVPALTEVRDFLVRFGRDARLVDVFIPSGNDYRPFSWKFFYWQHRLFGFHSEALNLVQFGLLGLCALSAYIHLRQLISNTLAASAASALWLFSLPVAHSAFWQATQHDKLGFLFTMLALIVSLQAIRSERRGYVALLIPLTLIFSALAVSTKPIAFMLPAAFAAQVVFFSPDTSWRGYLNRAGRITIPSLYVCVYALVYMLRTTPEWRAHTMAGDRLLNLAIYARNLTNSDFDAGTATAVLLLLPVAAMWLYALWNRSQAELKPALYFLIIFATGMAVLWGAMYPSSFYLLLPFFAFTASFVVISATLFADSRARIRRYAMVAASVVVIGLLSNYATAIAGQSRLHDWRTSANKLAAGYKVIRDTVNPENIQSMSFSIPTETSAFFYFFSDGLHQAIDPAIPSFIFGRRLDVPVSDSRLQGLSDAQTGKLFTAWSEELELVEVTLDGQPVYAGRASDSLSYALGQTIEFQQNGNGKKYKGQGWSFDEQWGTWSDGAEASLQLNLGRAYRSALDVSFRGQAFVTKEHPDQSVEVFANGTPVADWMFHNGESSTERKARIPADVTGSDTLKLTFKIKNPRSPASIGVSADTRALGILLEKLRIDLCCNGGS